MYSNIIYENIIFLQNGNAIDALAILEEEGEERAIEYLSQWHYSGEHEQTQNLNCGTTDNIFEQDNYILTYNLHLEYIALHYKIKLR